MQVKLRDAKLVSSKKAAKILNVTLGRIRQLIDEGKLTAEKLTERAWAIDLDTVMAYKNSYRKRGPKPEKMTA